MRSSQPQTLRCPLCRKGRIIDAADGRAAAKLNLYGPRQSAKAEWFTKCPKCGERIGIAFPKN